MADIFSQSDVRKLLANRMVWIFGGSSKKHGEIKYLPAYRTNGTTHLAPLCLHLFPLSDHWNFILFTDMRGIYKDLVWLIQRNEVIHDSALKRKVCQFFLLTQALNILVGTYLPIDT